MKEILTKAPLRHLLAIPIAVSLVACGGTPPEPDASNREKAFELCLAELKEKIIEINEEKELVTKYPERLDRESEDYGKGINYSFLHSDDDRDIRFVQVYCKPYSNSKYKGYWYWTGTYEYLVVPSLDDLLISESEVRKLNVTDTYSWKED